MKNILNNILDFTGGKRFYRFGNSDGKYWIMPARDMRTAMNLYQPSGSKGKLVKSLLPCLHFLAPVRKVIHAEKLHCRLNGDLRELLCKVFGTRDIEFSIFEGTPSASQKMILQINCGKRILGYCKISERKDIYKLFKQESENLIWLSNKNVEGIPQVLFCGAHNGMYLFIQSTAKSNASRIPHDITPQHENFLDKVYKATVQEMPFEESDFHHDISYLKSIIDKINMKERLVVNRAIGLIEEHYKEAGNSPFSFFHGDFTPWNMYIENGCLQVFDFEFSARSFPPKMDLIHYFLQIQILEKRLSADEIHPKLETFKIEYFISNTLAICYLIHILSFYFKLYNGNFDIHDNGYIIWNSLLKKQLDNTI